MSRGLGSLQRAILDHLQEHGRDSAQDIAWTLARRRRGGDDRAVRHGVPTRSELVAVRRAIHSLAARGLVVTWYEEHRLDYNDRRRPSLYCGPAGTPPPADAVSGRGGMWAEERPRRLARRWFIEDEGG